MFGDPDVVETAYGLPATASVGLASGGLPPEGMLYGDSVRSIVGELLALKTAGFADPAISGPQVALANNAPVWSRFVTGFISSLVPAQQIPADESYLGPVYEFASYGDILRMYATPDMVSVFGVLSLLDRQNNDLSRLNAERWFAINAVEGGAPSLLSRVRNPWTWGVQDSLFLFLLLDPAATTTDPRPNYPTAFYDPGQGRLIDRTDWTPEATLFDFRCSWESINHQQGDANQFEFYRKGEWLTKGVANYDDNDNGQSSDYHNTLTLQNWCTNGTPNNLLWELPFWTSGSQWPLALNNGDPTTYASVRTNYSYAFGDTTPLYNRPDFWNPANINQHFITGCVPNGFYQVTSANTPNGWMVIITPSASGAQADAAGVLAKRLLTVTAPRLNVVASPPNMILSWPTNTDGFGLNQTFSLVSPTTWTPVTSGITVSGTNYTITINTASGAGFYALIAP